MCGVAGIFAYANPERTVDRRLLVTMARLLRHRGPDGQGIWVDGPIGLAHRRLAIVDPSPTGYQPMSTALGDLVISYNGELYNHKKFRRQLEQKQHRFVGSSDTETLLHMIQEWGPDVLSQTAGIFAFAVWDARSRRLLLARDPLGVKQLYYHDDGRRIVFASEIKALLACPGVGRDIDPEGVNQYLQFHTPLFEKTFFRHIHQVCPGEYIEVNGGGQRKRIYWTVQASEPDARAPEMQVEALRESLNEIVGDQLMSDVPVGAFLSGGIDSSTVVAFARKHNPALQCFGVQFTGQGVVDERPYQESVARALGVPLELTTVPAEGFADELPKLLWHQDQPMIGTAMSSMYHVSALASNKVKVCLGGQAADELFGGYARHALLHPLGALRSWIARATTRNAQEIIGVHPPSDVGSNLLKQLLLVRNLRRLVTATPSVIDPPQLYFEVFAKVPDRTWRTLLDPAFVSRAKALDVFRATMRRSPFSDPADRVLHWEMQTYLPGLFHQDDRMSMANSLESRVPLADPRLAQLAFRIPFGLKIRHGSSKWILRQAVADVLPPEVLSRRKVGFDTPAESWIRGPHREFVRDTLLSTRARSRGWTQPDAVARLLDDTDSSREWFDLVWKLLMLETWATVLLDRRVEEHAPVVAKDQVGVGDDGA
jgi:asparagine synthase (glutamine-hydrolysing)